MLGTRVYVYADQKEKYFSDELDNEANEKAIIAAVKYFIFASNGENELCEQMSNPQKFDISQLSETDILEKQPLYVRPPNKLDSDVYEITLEYVMSIDGIDTPVDERLLAVIEVEISNETVVVKGISFS